MNKLYTSQDGYVDVFQDDAGTMYLVVLCGGIAWTHLGIVMNEQERADFAADPTSVNAVARRMCYDFDPFKDRQVPEPLRSQMLK